MNMQCVGDEFYFSELVPTRSSLFVAHLSWFIIMGLARGCPLESGTRTPNGLDGE
jgi:hypothetical protein